MMDHAEILKQVWPEWILEKKIGRGAYGHVYQARYEEHGIVSQAAIKVIPVPQDAAESDALRSEGMSDEEICAYYQNVVNDFISEIRMLVALKGAPHVVSIEDFKVVECPEELHWDILIRMELLTPFISYTNGHPLPEAEVVRLGIELCTALEICHRTGIIHRDIKPQNIFVDRFGAFKLGDFGIARQMEGMTGSMSQKGTYSYIAPEVSHSLRYDTRADIYSLGIVMYQQMNGCRLPFLDSMTQSRNLQARSTALQKRLAGEELPPPETASAGLSEIILKACAFKPEERYASASKMKSALQQLQLSAAVPSPAVAEEPGPESPPVGRPAETPDAEATVSSRDKPAAKPPETPPRTDADERTGQSRDEDASETAPAGSMPGPEEQPSPPPDDTSDKTIGSSSFRRDGSSTPRTPPEASRGREKKPEKKAKSSSKALIVAAVLLVAVVAAVGILFSSVFSVIGGVGQNPEGPTADGSEAQTDPVAENADSQGQKTVTASCDSTAGGVAPAKQTASQGEVVSVAAFPKNGYSFVRWEAISGLRIDSSLQEQNPLKIKIGSSDIKLKAVFAPVNSYPSSGEQGNLIYGAVIGNKTGWDNTEASGAASAFDGDPATFFDPLGIGNGFCGIQTDTPYILDKVAIRSREGWEERYKGAMIQGSNDGENWTTLWTSAAPSHSSEHFNIVTKSYLKFNYGYKMYRYFNETEHGDVAEVEFYGTPGRVGMSYDELKKAADGHTVIKQYAYMSGTQGFEWEEAERLFDGDIQTKFCTGLNLSADAFPARSAAKLDGTYRITGFALATGNDNVEFNDRNPAEWTIEVAEDGKNWTVIASGDDTFFEEKNQTYYVGYITPGETEAAEKVRYVRFTANITKSTIFQLSELVLFGDRQ